MKIQVPQLIACNQPGAYLVGGSVRDLIRGLTPVDYDIAVPYDPRLFAEEIAKRNGGRVVLLGKDRFAVYRVSSAQWNIDITTYKGRDIRQDLLARDFTINALACSLSGDRIVDVTSGLADLQHGVVRMISPEAFQDDPARLVRAFRMAAVFNFRIEPETIKAIGIHAGLLGQTAGERVWAEFTRILACPDIHRHLRMMAETKVLSTTLPELADHQENPLGCHHISDELNYRLQAVHTLERLLGEPEAFLPRGPVRFIESLGKESHALLKMSLLIRDIGKLACRRENGGGRAHFHGHAARGAELVQSIGRRLKMPNRQREWIANLVRRHQRPYFLYLANRSNENLPPKAVGRFFRQCGKQTPQLLIQAMAETLCKASPSVPDTQEFIGFLSNILSTYCEKNLAQGLPPILNGKDLIDRFELHPSPLLGTLLRRLEELHLAGAITNRQQAFEWVAQHLKSK
jgi:tRNA nucleotidyltransferase/poly(A) polymerase